MKKLFILCSLIVLLGCKEECVLVGEFMPPPSDRVVLIEELTGASCPACPIGTSELESLELLYGDQLVVVAVHGDFQSWPTSDSKYDFRNDPAKDIEGFLQPWQGKPAAAINRVDFGLDFFAVDVDLWSNLIDQELAKQHVLEIGLSVNYNSETRAVGITGNIAPLENVEGDFSVTLMVLESHIIDAQLNNTNTIPDYEFNHVLRDMITSNFGDPIGSDLQANELININYNYTLPLPTNPDDELWIPENCEIVAFVHHSGGAKKDVLQAVKAKVVN